MIGWGAPSSKDQVGMTGHDLADLFESGGWPPPLAAPMRLEADETCYAQGPVRMQVFAEGDGNYVHKTAFGLSPLGLAIGAGTMLGNQRRKASAARESAAQWRPAGEGILYITNRRILVSETQQWNTFWHQQVMATHCDGTAIEVQREDAPAIRFALPNIDYYFVMFYRLAFNELRRPASGR